MTTGGRDGATGAQGWDQGSTCSWCQHLESCWMSPGPWSPWESSWGPRSFHRSGGCLTAGRRRLWGLLLGVIFISLCPLPLLILGTLFYLARGGNLHGCNKCWSLLLGVIFVSRCPLPLLIIGILLYCSLRKCGSVCRQRDAREESAACPEDFRSSSAQEPPQYGWNPGFPGYQQRSAPGCPGNQESSASGRPGNQESSAFSRPGNQKSSAFGRQDDEQSYCRGRDNQNQTSGLHGNQDRRRCVHCGGAGTQSSPGDVDWNTGLPASFVRDLLHGFFSSS